MENYTRSSSSKSNTLQCCPYCEDLGDTDCDDPTTWDSTTLSKWNRIGLPLLINKANAAATSTSTIEG